MKATTRFLAFVFAAVMLLSLASCADNQGNNNEITTAPEATVEGEVTEELYLGYEKDKLPTDLTYNNESVKVLYWSDAERKEFEIKEDEDDSDRIVSAIKARNEVVQQRLGITFDWDSTKGNSKHRAEFTKYVETQFNGGNYYDIIATYSRTSGMLATRGFLMDLNTIENNYIDYEQNWWPATIIDVCTIAKSLYFVSGDISTNTLHFMYGIYFNKELIADRQLEDPQTLVKNGTWTIGKLIEMTSDTYEDRDNSNSKSVEDFYGFCTLYFHCDAFYTGSDLRLVDNDEDNVLIISPDFSSEKAINLVDQLGQWLTTDSCYFDESSGNYQKPFVNGTALFCQNRVYMADAQNGSGLNAVTWKYGIVPTPKYNEDQTDYITVMGNPFTLYGVGNGCDDPSRATGIWQTVWLECVPAAYIQNVKYYTDIDNSILSADITVSGGDGLTLLATAEYDGVVVGTSSALVSGKLARITVPLSELHLWEPGEGRLYGLSLELCGEHPDRVESYFGMRSVTSKNGILYINHKPVFQRLVLDQGFYPDGIYTAPDDAGLIGDIERSTACGFNGARLHQKIFEPRFLYHCDRMGYIVWGEHANWGLDISAPEAWKGFLGEWLECLVRDFSHPAIIGWCPLNETQKDQDSDFVRAVAALTRAFDPTRPYIDASGWAHVEGITDIMDCHDYDQNPETFRARYNGVARGEALPAGKHNLFDIHPTFVSEYGGIRWAPDCEGWGYGNAPESGEEFIARFRGLTDALLDCPIMGGLCYTQLTDVEQEVNGLYTYDRKPKFPPEIFREILSRPAAIEKE